MAINTARAHRAAHRSGQRDRFEYRALVAVSFLPCLALAAWRRAAGLTSDDHSSLFAQALSSARAAIGFAYLA